jgi:hypothetical protein
MVSTKLAMGVFAGAALFAAVPANATITTFADYKTIGAGANIYWKNNSGSTAGTGGSIYTIGSAGATTAGSRNVAFSFLQSELAPYVTNVTGKFTLLASVTNSPVLTLGGIKIQQNIAGSFSILSTSVITIGNLTFGIGANLLSGVFTQSAIAGAGAGTSGSFSASTTGGSTITYTSDFLNFLPTNNRDFSLGLTSITQALANSNGKALRTFKATSTGSFSTDPAPVPINAVPEAATWAMFIGGFGLMGAALRRRRPEHSLV